jgi:hypothetical protein
MRKKDDPRDPEDVKVTSGPRRSAAKSAMFGHQYYEDDILPYVIEPGSVGDGPQIFEITADLPFPSSDVVIRAVEVGCDIGIGVEDDSGKRRIRRMW